MCKKLCLVGCGLVVLLLSCEKFGSSLEDSSQINKKIEELNEEFESYHRIIKDMDKNIEVKDSVQFYSIALMENNFIKVTCINPNLIRSVRYVRDEYLRYGFRKVVITSALEKTTQHTPGSRHYKGNALDLSTRRTMKYSSEMPLISEIEQLDLSIRILKNKQLNAFINSKTNVVDFRVVSERYDENDLEGRRNHLQIDIATNKSNDNIVYWLVIQHEAKGSKVTNKSSFYRVFKKELISNIKVTPD